MNSKTSSIKNNLRSDKSISENQTKLEASDSLTTTNYKPDSYWSNVMYGIGMLAFIMIPEAIPGLTVEVTAIGLYSLIIGTYVAALLFHLIKIKKPPRHRKRTTKH
jgi:hypothetical protein